MPSRDTTAHIPPRALVLLFVLTLLWGTNWPLFAYAVREVSVWTFRAVAMTLSGLALLLVARARGQSLIVPRRHWGTMLATAVSYLVLWNIASTYAALLIPSGQAAIVGYTMPLWLALLSWAFLGQKMTARLRLAIALGGAAVLLLMLRGAEDYARAPLGFALGLLAGLGWAVGTLILKARPVSVPAMVLTGWQLLVAAVPIVMGAFLLGDGQWFMPTWQSMAVIGYIALVPMSIGNAAWFTIVGMLPANVAALASIMVPVVAMLTGALMHGEPLGAVQWAAMACCVGGLALAMMKPRATSA